MSAFLPIATELRTSLEVRFVPRSEVTITEHISLRHHAIGLVAMQKTVGRVKTH
jgi:hypothetical protein